MRIMPNPLKLSVLDQSPAAQDKTQDQYLDPRSGRTTSLLRADRASHHEWVIGRRTRSWKVSDKVSLLGVASCVTFTTGRSIRYGKIASRARCAGALRGGLRGSRPKPNGRGAERDALLDFLANFATTVRRRLANKEMPC